MKETIILNAILDYLAARRILSFRMNTGAMKIDKRFVQFGVPGMADILALHRRITWEDNGVTPIWIEVKTATGKQSDLQKSFQRQVEDEGHKYIIARSIDDVEEALK
jgi:hypothetical protein